MGQRGGQPLALHERTFGPCQARVPGEGAEVQAIPSQYLESIWQDVRV